MLLSEHTFDSAREALRNHLSDLMIASERLEREHSTPAKKAIEAACRKILPLIIILARDVREARENSEFFQWLYSSPGRNVEAIIALVQKLVSLVDGTQKAAQAASDSERSNHTPTESNEQSTPRRKRGRPSKIPDELKVKALTVQGGKARAKILFQTDRPTDRQVKDASKILSYRQKHQPRDS